MADQRPERDPERTVEEHRFPGQANLSRRRLFTGVGAGAVAGALAGAAIGAGVEATGQSPEDSDTAASVDFDRSHPFYTGDHQAGIDTTQQRYCVLMTFDLVSATSTDLQVLLARWSAAIAQLMRGKPIGAVQPERAGAVPADTGEAYELGPSSLTVTVGLGPGIFGDRLGLADRRPRHLANLPKLPSDQLQAEFTGGDLSLQACADDPQVAYHAIRDLARLGRGVVNTRWTVIGFGRASAGKGQTTPRNLMGFKDGTRNIKEPVDFDDHVWVAGDDVDWMRGGCYQVVRKIQMNIEIWDADNIADQQRIFGRTKRSGAPLSGSAEFDTPDFTARDGSGDLRVNAKSHIALAAHENNDGVKILRRSYNYTDGISRYGQLDAGLLFIAYMKNPDQFVRLQSKLGSSDLLNEYIAHIGSALFVVPPAPRTGHYIAQQLFE